MKKIIISIGREFGSGEWQTVSGGFRMYFHGTLLIYSKIT